MRRRLFVLVLIALSPLVLVACDTEPDPEFTALEGEVVTLREDFDAFNEQWGTFYEDWTVYREDVGLAD